jgi:hypothetical protein
LGDRAFLLLQRDTFLLFSLRSVATCILLQPAYSL